MKTDTRTFRAHTPLPPMAEAMVAHVAQALGVSLEVWNPSSHHGHRLALGPACEACEHEDPRTFDRCRKRRAYLTRPEVALPERLAEKCPRRVRLSRRGTPADATGPLVFAFGHGIDDPAAESDLGIACFLGDVRSLMQEAGTDAACPATADERFEAQSYFEIACGGAPGDAEGAAREMPATELVTALVTTLESRRPAQRGHARRVRLLAVLIGRELGLDAATLGNLHWAALLHAASALGATGPDDGEACALDATRDPQVPAAPRTLPLLHGVPGSSGLCTILQHHRQLAAATDAAAPLVRAAGCLDLADALDILLSQPASRRPRTLHTAIAALASADARFDPHALAALQRLQPQLQRHAWIFLLHRHGTI